MAEPPAQQPGERRPSGTTTARGWQTEPQHRRPRPAPSLRGAFLYAVLIALAAAGAWVALHSILGLGVFALAAMTVAAWAIGVLLRQAGAPGWWAPTLAGLAWLAGLVACCRLAMATLPASSRTLAERIVTTPFLDWLAPQAGPVEVLGLVLSVGVAAWVAWPSARRGR